MKWPSPLFTRASLGPLRNGAVSGFLQIERANGDASVRVLAATLMEAETLTRTREQLREEGRRWAYFGRALRLHRGEKTYLFKPIQQLHWIRIRAMLDAADVAVSSIQVGAPR